MVSFTINSKALQNKGGEDPNRKVSVYLPPNYDASTQRYPVIYYLHGFMGKDNIFPQMQKVLDEGISRQKLNLSSSFRLTNIHYLKEAFIQILL